MPKKKSERPYLRLLAFVALLTSLVLVIAGVVRSLEFIRLYGKEAVLVNGEAGGLNLSDERLYSASAILTRVEDGACLYQKDSEKMIYPASLTKIMTAFVALEQLESLQENITLEEGIFTQLEEKDASVAGYLPGETVHALDLIYGVLLPSGAECSLGLAQYLTGSEKGFVKLMNEKAKELGMEKTHFSNVTGLHQMTHYTTVKDLELLLREALKNKTFRTVFTAKSYTVRPTDFHPQGFTLYSTLFQNTDGSLPEGRILGGKTGYTEKAGLCLASLAEVGGQEYILITAGASGNHQTEQFSITDAVTVYGAIPSA